MAIKKFKPVTPGTRFRAINANDEITREKPERSLTEPLNSIVSAVKIALEQTPDPHADKRLTRVLDTHPRPVSIACLQKVHLLPHI